MERVFFDENGTPQSLPAGQEGGKRYKSLLYADHINTCPECKGYVFYTINKVCLRCAQTRACDLYSYLNTLMEFVQGPDGWWTSYYEVNGRLGVANRPVHDGYRDELDELAKLMYIVPPRSREDAVRRGETLWLTGDPCEKAGHYGIITLSGECYFCEEDRKKPKPRADARKAGKNWYIPDVLCVKCNTIAERNVQDNRCRGCLVAKTSPRQEALKAGKKWYTPDTPCLRCNTIAEKRVDNGICRGCVPEPVIYETPENVMMRTQPDLILPKETAVALGMKVYRTGRACRRGHSGYRYVSTNNCIDCIKRRKIKPCT